MTQTQPARGYYQTHSRLVELDSGNVQRHGLARFRVQFSRTSVTRHQRQRYQRRGNPTENRGRRVKPAAMVNIARSC